MSPKSTNLVGRTGLRYFLSSIGSRTADSVEILRSSSLCRTVSNTALDPHHHKLAPDPPPAALPSVNAPAPRPVPRYGPTCIARGSLWRPPGPDAAARLGLQVVDHKPRRAHRCH